MFKLNIAGQNYDKIEELEELLWTINDQLFDHFSKDWNLEGNKK